MKIQETNIPGDYEYYCPQCEYLHCIPTQRKNGKNSSWTFDGNHEAPTFHPSVKVTTNVVCHHTITAGKIKYWDDTDQKFRGTTVDLPEIPLPFLRGNK